MAKTPDRRVLRTQQLLRGALLSLIQEKGFEALSVQEIIDRANVGRATFYAHFDSKEDLLASGIENLRASLQQRQKRATTQSAGDERVLAFSHELFVHANEHRDVFRAMVGRRSGAVVQQLLHKMLVDLIRDEVQAMNERRSAGAVPLEAAVQVVAGGLFGLLIWWGSGKMRLSVDDVNALFRRLAVPALKAALA